MTRKNEDISTEDILFYKIKPKETKGIKDPKGLLKPKYPGHLIALDWMS